MTRRLVIRPGAIGDVIVSLPAIESLRCGYLEVWTSHPALVRFADRVRSIVSTGLDLLGVTDPPPGLLEDLAGFDSIVSWYGATRPDFRELARFQFLDALPPPECTMPAADFYLQQVGAPLGAVPRIAVPPVPRSGAIIHPFSGSARKNWPLDRFRELAEQLPLAVEWCAGPEEDLPGAIRIPDLYDLACRLAAAQVFIGNDSGIAHLAAAAGTPVVALFGPTDPRVWAPRGDRVRVVARTEMAAIGVHEVREAVGALLK